MGKSTKSFLVDINVWATVGLTTSMRTTSRPNIGVSLCMSILFQASDVKLRE